MGSKKKSPTGREQWRRDTTLHLETFLLIIKSSCFCCLCSWGREKQGRGEKTRTKPNQEANHRVKRLQAPHCHFSLCRYWRSLRIVLPHINTQKEGRQSREAEQGSSLSGQQGCWWGRCGSKNTSRRQGDVCTCPRTAKDWRAEKQIVTELQSAWDLLQARGTSCCPT